MTQLIAEPAATDDRCLEEARSPGGQRGWRLIAVLGSLIALGPLSVDLYLPSLPAIQTGLRTTPAGVQLTLTGIMVGMAVGNLLVGPLSDALGRRRPLLAGLGLYAIASVLCGVAPTIAVFGVLRVLQGVGVAAASVIATAVIRDLFDGSALAHLMSRILLVPLAAPVVAPSIGGALLRWTQWRGVFVVLAVLGLLLIALAAARVAETLPPRLRRPARLGAMLRSYRVLLGDRRFVALTLMTGLAMAALMAYVGGASFVLQQEYGLSQQQFGLAFGAGGLGLVLVSQVNVLLLRRLAPERILLGALVVGSTAGLALLVFGGTGTGGLAGVLVPLWLMVAAIGLTFPNGPALALSRHGERAGAAAALLGAVQFGLGGLAAPMVGLLGGGTVAIAVVSATAMLAATGLSVLVLSARPARVGSSS
jgi:MFS transporter, DHA1 family, multidrug resistance protein